MGVLNERHQRVQVTLERVRRSGSSSTDHLARDEAEQMRTAKEMVESLESALGKLEQSAA